MYFDICQDHSQVPTKICLVHLRNNNMNGGVLMRNLLNLLTSKGLLKKNPTSSIEGSTVIK